MKLKVGQVVHIKSDLNPDYYYDGCPGYICELEEWRGKPVTVKEISDNDWFTYWIEEDGIKDIADEEFLSLIEGD